MTHTFLVCGSPVGPGGEWDPPRMCSISGKVGDLGCLGCSVEELPWGAGEGVWPRPLGEHWALRLPLAALAGRGRQPVIDWAQQVSLD